MDFVFSKDSLTETYLGIYFFIVMEYMDGNSLSIHKHFMCQTLNFLSVNVSLEVLNITQNRSLF